MSEQDAGFEAGKPLAGSHLQSSGGAAGPQIAVVIPCFRGVSTICGVIRNIGPIVARIYIVDDGCPDGSGEHVARECADPRIAVLYNETNLGVGGAMKRGYRQALLDGADIVVKIDADGQMDPAFIPDLLRPILAGGADYAKGNRFAPPHLMPSAAAGTEAMPPVRRIGNALFSRLHKIVTGYWGVADPANGYTALRRAALERIDVDALANCYFFETDILFQLNLAGAVVRDVPIPALYGDEVSSLRLRRVLPRFPAFAVSRIWTRLQRRWAAIRRGIEPAPAVCTQESGG